MKYTILKVSFAALLVGSYPAFAQSGGPTPAVSNRVHITSAEASDSTKPKATSIRIVCARTIEVGNQPLYIINGHLATEEAIKKVNPNDIDRVDVLKGVQATALYGARAANGAILITLKK